MAAGIEITSFLRLAETNPLFLVEDKYIRGGCRIVADIAARDALLTMTYHLKAGMLVITQSDLKIWQLGTDLTTWTEFTGGGSSSTQARQMFEYTTATIAAGESEQFTTTLGKTITILNLAIDQGYAQIQAFAYATRSDTNPYTFVAVPTHLTDDGSTTMQDGTVVKGRRYTILSNLESPPSENIYWTITNNGTVPQQYKIQIVYVKME